MPFRQWLKDYINDTFHLDSKLVRSLAMLVRQPGALTLEYIGGRRSAYVRPFRLYLTASFLYFLALSIAPPRDLVQVRVSQDPANLSVVLQGAEDEQAGPPQVPLSPPKLKEDTAFKRQLNRFIAQGPVAAREQVLRDMVRSLPKAMFALVPLFALLLWRFFRKSGRFYSEHFLFALHFHAFAFFLLTPFLFVSLGGWRVLVQGAIVGYLFLALRRVYGESRARTGLKAAALLASYGFVLLCLIVGTALLSIYSAR